jgi:hypothetical protein
MTLAGVLKSLAGISSELIDKIYSDACFAT